MTTQGTTTRRCIGSSRFGIEAHDADASDFPAQPSQKDGLGRMCKPHWRQYTNALRTAAVTRKATEAEPSPATEVAPEPEPEAVEEPEPVTEPESPAPRRRRAKAAAEPEVDEADAA